MQDKTKISPHKYPVVYVLYLSNGAIYLSRLYVYDDIHNHNHNKSNYMIHRAMSIKVMYTFSTVQQKTYTNQE